MIIINYANESMRISDKRTMTYCCVCVPEIDFAFSYSQSKTQTIRSEQFNENSHFRWAVYPTLCWRAVLDFGLAVVINETNAPYRLYILPSILIMNGAECLKVRIIVILSRQIQSLNALTTFGSSPVELHFCLVASLSVCPTITRCTRITQWPCNLKLLLYRWFSHDLGALSSYYELCQYQVLSLYFEHLRSSTGSINMPMFDTIWYYLIYAAPWTKERHRLRITRSL